MFGVILISVLSILVRKYSLIVSILIIIGVSIYIYEYPIYSPDYHNYKKTIVSGDTWRWDTFYVLLHYMAVRFRDVDLMYVTNYFIVMTLLLVLSKNNFMTVLVSIIMPKSLTFIFWLPRQYLAIYFCLFLTLYHKRILSFIVPFLLHSSAILYILFFLRKVRLKHALVVLIILSVSLYFYRDTVDMFLLKFNSYNYLDKSGNNWFLFIMLVIGLIIFLRSAISSSVIYLGLFSVFLFLLNFKLPGISLRVSYLLLPFVWILAGQSLFYRKSARNYLLSISFLFLMFFLNILSLNAFTS